MIALDASVLIALLRGEDRHHPQARALMLVDREFAVHPVNLAEALVAPVRAGRETQAMGAWEDAGVEEWTTTESAAMDLARLRVATRLRLPDCCPILVAEATTRRLATFDERLARAARDRGIEVLGAAS